MSEKVTVSFNIPDKIKQQKNYRDSIRLLACLKKRERLLEEYPIIEELEDTLSNFKDTIYDFRLIREVSWWVESKICQLCYDKKEILDKSKEELYKVKTLGNIDEFNSNEEIRPFINNFKWYNVVLKFLIREQTTSLSQLFIDNTLNIAYIYDLVISILGVCNDVFGQTLKIKKEYKRKSSAVEGMRKSYSKFSESFEGDIKYFSIEKKELEKNLEYCSDLLTPINQFIKNLENKIKESESKEPEYYSRKNKDTENDVVTSVIKIINSYIKKVSDKVTIKEPNQLLADIGNSLMSVWLDENYISFTRKKVTSILKNSSDNIR